MLGVRRRLSPVVAFLTPNLPNLTGTELGVLWDLMQAHLDVVGELS